MSHLTIELTIAAGAASQLWLQEGVVGFSTLQSKPETTFDLQS
ncbi:hypothetical protein [Sphingorhabdus sp.]